MGEQTLKIQLLPVLALERGGQPVTLPKSKKTRALLAYLALSKRPVPRERLCEIGHRLKQPGR